MVIKFFNIQNSIFDKKNKRMKIAKFIKFFSFTLLLACIVSCSVHNSSSSSGKVPPGQAKKMSGSKSAKAYAPGQQKKIR